MVVTRILRDLICHKFVLIDSHRNDFGIVKGGCFKGTTVRLRYASRYVRRILDLLEKGAWRRHVIYTYGDKSGNLSLCRFAYLSISMTWYVAHGIGVRLGAKLIVRGEY